MDKVKDKIDLLLIRSIPFCGLIMSGIVIEISAAALISTLPLSNTKLVSKVHKLCQ
jgi:hypothetical protein